jgi:hypothetical protein
MVGVTRSLTRLPRETQKAVARLRGKVKSPVGPAQGHMPQLLLGTKVSERVTLWGLGADRERHQITQKSASAYRDRFILKYKQPLQCGVHFNACVITPLFTHSLAAWENIPFRRVLHQALPS